MTKLLWTSEIAFCSRCTHHVSERQTPLATPLEYSIHTITKHQPGTLAYPKQSSHKEIRTCTSGKTMGDLAMTEWLWTNDLSNEDTEENIMKKVVKLPNQTEIRDQSS